MARPCSICGHAERRALDQALVAGVALRAIAERFGTSATALHRHKAEHLPRLVAKAERREEARDVARALDVVGQLRDINAAALTVLAEARKRKQGELALKAIDRIQKQIELQAKLLGELDERPQVNVLVAPEWIALRGRIVGALAPFPAARLALAAVLEADGHVAG